jgi:hypothetical protein
VQEEEYLMENGVSSGEHSTPLSQCMNFGDHIISSHSTCDDG